MKRKRRRYEVHISPDNLIVGPWARPIPKHEKRISIVSAIICVICVVTIIVFEKVEYSPSVITDFLGFVLVLVTPISFCLSLIAPATFLGHQFFRIVANAEAREEMREREEREKEEREKEERLAEEAKEWAD